MKKVVESTFTVLVIFFALAGIVASFFMLRVLYLEAKYDELYINNCQKVRIGMTLEEAKIAMGGQNYREHEKSYTYWTSFEKGRPSKFSIDYPTSGSSYTTVIYYHPITGLVTEVVCSGY